MLVRTFLYRVGVMNSSLQMLMPVVLASTSMRYLNVAGMYSYTRAMLVQACRRVKLEFKKNCDETAPF